MRQHMKDYIEFGETGAARSVRILAEFMRACEAFERLSEHSLVTIFGSARMEDGSAISQLAERLGRQCVAAGYGVVTGGSSGVMLASNRGAYQEAQARGLPVEEYSIGCGITLPFEEGRNAFVGTQTDFHYFFIRKFFLVAYSRAFFFLEGGAGTRDELWEVFCLIQTGKMPITPLIAVGNGEAWKTLQADLKQMAARGTISEADRNILRFVATAEEGLEVVARFYRRLRFVQYDKENKTIDLHLSCDLSRSELGLLEERFAPALNGLRWNPERRILSASQFNFRSYVTLYDLVETISELGQPQLPAGATGGSEG